MRLCFQIVEFRKYQPLWLSSEALNVSMHLQKRHFGLLTLIGFSILVGFLIIERKNYKLLPVQETFKFTSPYHCGTMDCIAESFRNRSEPQEKMILIQLNNGFKELGLNLICSVIKSKIPKRSIQIWSLDQTVHEFVLNLGINSYFEPNRYFGTSAANNYHSEDYLKMMRQRAEFWTQPNHPAGSVTQFLGVILSGCAVGTPAAIGLPVLVLCGIHPFILPCYTCHNCCPCTAAATVAP